MNINHQNLFVILLLGFVFFVPFFSMQNFSPAVDEITHLPSGYSYLKTGEIKLNPQHPPLMKMLAALPLLFLDLKFDPNDPNLAEPEIREWKFGQDLLFNNGIDRLIFWGRIPIILISVLLGIYVFKWSKELFGYGAGIAGLFIYALMPNIIANAQLITMDLGVTAFCFIALYYLWKFTNNSAKRDIILSGLFLGLALGAKFSAIFLLPIFLIVLIVHVHKKYRNSSLLFKINSLLKIILPIFGLAYLTVWALYLFPTDPLFYWHGLNTVYADHKADYNFYLNGSFSGDGWWYYFLWAFIIKTPVPFLAVLSAGLIYWKKQGLSIRNGLFIFLPVALFLFVTSWKGRNIGVRYILPIYPFLILYVSGYLAITMGTIAKSKFAMVPIVIIVILAGWYIFSSVSIYPDYLAYFNEFVGGSNNGYKYLDDSNIDLGYDLKRLAEYQNKEPDLKVAFAWSTYVDAGRFYGIKNIETLNSKKLWLTPNGKYAVSTHAVIRTRLAGQVNKIDQINWMDSYKPIDRIGQSFLIYEFK